MAKKRGFLKSEISCFANFGDLKTKLKEEFGLFQYHIFLI